MAKPKPSKSQPIKKSAATKPATTAAAPASKTPTKLDKLVAALKAPSGATIPDLMTLTGWQAHSVRGALSGALKKQRGHTIVSAIKNGERVYRIGGRA